MDNSVRFTEAGTSIVVQCPDCKEDILIRHANNIINSSNIKYECVKCRSMYDVTVKGQVTRVIMSKSL